MRPRLVLVIWLCAALGAAGLLVPTTRHALGRLGTSTGVAVVPAAAIATQAAPPPPTLQVPAGGVSGPSAKTAFFGWALLNRATGAISGSANEATGTNTTESMIKAWIASDYLRRTAAAGKTPSAKVLSDLNRMLDDSNDDIAQAYYNQDGGNAVIQRLISTCGLKHTTVHSGWWSMTLMPPDDAVRYGACVADGRAAGAQWTPWILQTMREVRGTVDKQPADQKTGGGHWGIIDTLPTVLADQTSIKNGWTFIYADGLWHVNCLAVHPDFVLAVMMRYRSSATVAGLKVGDGICQSVTQQLVHVPDL